MNTSSTFSIVCALFAVCIFGVLIPDTDARDEFCPGQHAFYQDLGCTPVRHAGCPYKYKCNSLRWKHPKGCYLHGNKFRIGHELTFAKGYRKCVCQQPDEKSKPRFVCTPLPCPGRPKDGCYRKRTAMDPCPGEEVCSNERPVCEANRKTYQDGEEFIPETHPHLLCYCGVGYNNTNAAPFCKAKPKNFHLCQIELYDGDKIADGCAPKYKFDGNVAGQCTYEYRCPKNTDIIKRNPRTQIRPNVKCMFGNMTMNFGDVVLPGNDSDSKGVKCYCHVGPLPYCRILKKKESKAVEKQ